MSIKIVRKKALIISLLIALGVGIVSGVIAMSSMDEYKEVKKPPFSPPGFVFPIVWCTLFILMGISAYMVYIRKGPKEEGLPFLLLELERNRNISLIVYAVSLVVNFVWPVLFFNLNSYRVAFVGLVLLWILIIVTIVLYNRVSHIAAYLQIPYLLWVTYAGYLNLGVACLQKVYK